MKKIIIPIILVIVFIIFAIMFLVPKNDKKEIKLRLLFEKHYEIILDINEKN